MGISKFIRGAAHGAASVGRAVQSASRKLDEAVAGQAPPPGPVVPMTPTSPAQASVQPQGTPPPEGTAPAAAPAANAPAQPTTPAPRGFTLPDIGVAPARTDSKYTGDSGDKLYQRDLEDFQHKQDIHQAFQDLDRIYSEAHPGRDFQKEYEEQVAMQAQHEQERPKGNGLARFALALGDQNPAVQQSGRSNLADYDKNIADEQNRSDDSYSKRMMLRSKMHEQKAAEAESKGNFRQALAEQEKLAMLKTDEASISQRRTAEAANQRATIRADAMERVAKTRATAIAESHGLTGNFLTQFQKAAAGSLGKLFGPRDLTKDYDPADLDTLTNYVEHLAEIFHDQQHGEGSSETYHTKHPNKRTPEKKPTF